MKVDLHCHTCLSDGKHPAAYVIERALENELTHLAITDHDYAQTHSHHENDGLTLIPGVEISCQWGSFEIHVVGLFIDPENISLQTLLSNQQARRHARVAAMDEKLAALGTRGLLANLTEQPAVALTRSHVADFLVARGVCKTRQKAFKTHLNKSGKLYVPAQWCDLSEAVSAIKSARGIAVMAHPGRYPLNKTKLRQLVSAFCEAGGDALEVSYPHIAPEMASFLDKTALANNLYLSAGSDFHDAGAHWTDVGKYPWLNSEASERAVWHHPIWLEACSCASAKEMLS